MTQHDQYIQSQVMPILQPGEQVLHTAYMRRQPGLLMQLLLVGGLLLFLMTKAYFAVLTNRRLLLIRSKVSFWSFSGAPKLMNLGLEEHDVRQIQNVTTSGFANNRSMTFHMANGPRMTLRISPWFKTVSGTKAFFEQVPQLVTSGQLAQLAAASVAAMPAQAGYGQQQGYAQQPQAYSEQQQPQAYPQQPLQPGMPVTVVAQDGNRYQATFVQEQGGHCLCAMQDGQQHWFPAQAVAPS